MMEIERKLAAFVCFASLCCLIACSGEDKSAPREANFRPRDLADAVHAVAAAHRAVYTQQVVNRLSAAGIAVAHEEFEARQALILPAQLFRYSAEQASAQNLVIDYSLKSLWPINPDNKAASQTEEIALQTVANTPGTPYYTEELAGGSRYFLAAYADLASAPICVECHNEHPQSPKTDFRLNDVMGAVLVRVAMN